MKKTFLADGSLLFVAFIWGATFVIVQKAIQFLPPHLFNGTRFLLAALLLSLFLKKKTKISFTIESVKSGMFLGFFLFLGYAFQTIGLLYTTSSKAGFITGLSVMIVPLLSVWILKEKPRSIIFSGAIIGAIGLYFLTVGDMSGLNLGDLLVFFCAIAFALHIIFTSKFSKNHDALPLTIVQLLTVSLLSFFSSIIFEQSSISFESFINKDVLIALAITSVFATALAFLIQTKFQQFTTAARVALIFAMEPVFAALTAFIFINERLSGNGLIGCFFIFTAMIVTELPDIRQSKWFNLKQKHGM
ncbi:MULTISPECIES: DMT family transporter [Metabacillus]|jgi:drug/metabolite transporter (DMT)-like permease|uniref:DMT family transporter n=1 Tax=Metabacillus rhizolycopersici TaxID=2875709 RepID=A0ABS7UMM3_9BACI|nr:MULTISPECIES: DMT family transporter [Metabacillus]MBZ5749185.1 DMT family transporter [Metabacillus rhizolycopersici]MCM3652044.1 DMT family transporter [Metabacillus litoralis]